MDESRLLEYLDADYRRLREVAPGVLGETVPTCPEWTVADLVRHVAGAYDNALGALRHGAFRTKGSPAPDLGGDPLAALDRAHRELAGELSSRKPDEHAVTWYAPDQTVGFWIRRMVQESVIHRVDGELGAGLEPAAIPADLAADGIDEVLVTFLAFASASYPQVLAEHLATCDGDTLRIEVPDASWLVQLGPDVVTVAAGVSADADAVLRGPADAVLRWLWRRIGNAAVELDGNRGVIGKLHQLLGDTTQ